MAHDMRRSNRELGAEEARKIVSNGDWCVLTVVNNKKGLCDMRAPGLNGSMSILFNIKPRRFWSKSC